MSLIFWYLICGHALCDYPLQGDFLARGKNNLNPIPGIPWYQCLMAHSLIHAGMVTIITSNVYLGFAEFIAHCVIDYGKCNNKYGFNEDQIFHVICKLAWVIILLWAQQQ